MASSVIPLQDAVKVDITLDTLFARRRNFGLPLFVTIENTPGIDQGERVRRYFSLAEVAVDWNATDEAYLMAQTAFAQRPQPSEILIGIEFTASQAGFLQCEPLASGVDLAKFKLVADGSFKISVDGDPLQDITGLDFSAAADFPAIAVIITAAITGATCTYDADKNRFVFTSGTVGNDSVVDFLETGSAGTDLSGEAYLNGTEESSARKVPGLTFVSVVDELDHILKVNDEAYFFALDRSHRDVTPITIEQIAQWVEALPNGHQVFFTTNDPIILDPTEYGDIGSILLGLGVKRSWVQYSGFNSEYPEVSALSRAATVNWEGQDTALTLKFKTLPTITPENASGEGAPPFRQAQLNVLRSKNSNAYSTMGGLPQIVSDAEMSSGNYQDEVHFADWLANAIQTNVFNILQSAPTKIPYTEPGLDQLQAGIARALEQGIRNGGLAPALDANGRFVPAYRISRIPVRDIDPATRASRVYPGFQFVAYLSGAIHAVKPIEGTLTVELP
jgi:hypothetical protein